MQAIRGQILSFEGDPFARPAVECLRHESDGVVVVDGGRIVEVGPAARVLPALPEGTAVHEHRGSLVLAGFVDAHVHYPQLPIIGAWGTQLLDWLERHALPAERAFADPGYARAVARFYLDECLRNGITTAAVFGTVHPQSVDALFHEASRDGMRMIAGKVAMDRNVPEDLRDTAQSAYDESKRLLERWHGNGRSLYAITPRFAAASSPAQLAVLGALRREFPDAFVQTHLAETEDEVAWVRRLHLECSSYVEVYERAGLLGARTLVGHGIHLQASEWRRLAETGTAIVHCPTSNLFLGSGLFDLRRAVERERVAVALGTDVGAGTSLSMLRTMGAAYAVAQLRGFALHPVQALYLATLGGARALGLEDRIGNLVPGNEADLVVLDLAPTPLLAYRMRSVEELEEALFLLMILGDERAVEATYVAGNLVYSRTP